MTAFVKSFDLGSIEEDKETDNEGPKAFIEIHTTGNCGTQASKRREGFAPPAYRPGTGHAHRDDVTPTIDNSFPQRPMYVGDFAGDLGPANGLDPLRRLGPNSGGSLMGPNHPMFRGGGMTGVGDGSGFGMRPRFDPFGPPGGPQEIDPNNPGRPPRMRPGGAGEPNPDLLMPPNSLGGNMFT